MTGLTRRTFVKRAATGAACLPFLSLGSCTRQADLDDGRLDVPAGGYPLVEAGGSEGVSDIAVADWSRLPKAAGFAPGAPVSVRIEDDGGQVRIPAERDRPFRLNVTGYSGRR